jgi:hypothetical protein
MLKSILIFVIFSVHLTLAQDGNSKNNEADTTGKSGQQSSWMKKMYDNISKDKFKEDSGSSGAGIDSINYFKEIKASELTKFKDQKVIITGTPVVLKDDYFLLLSDKKLIQINCNSHTKTADANLTKNTINTLIEKGEKETIYVYGIAVSPHALEGKYLDINKKIIEMYERK